MSDFHDEDNDPQPREPRRPRATGGGATYAGRGGGSGPIFGTPLQHVSLDPAQPGSAATW